MIINCWLALRDDAQALIIERLRWNEETDGEYTGPVTDRQNKLFSYMADQETTRHLWRHPTVGGRVYHLWSVYFNLPGNVLLQVKAELDQLTADYPQHVIIAGAWRWDGTQIADYPPHPQLEEFMPEVPVFDADGNQTGTVHDHTLRDVNLLQGQSPRNFGV